MADAETVIDRCQSALQRLSPSFRASARALFNGELRLIEDNDGWSSLIAAFEQAQSFNESSTACQVIGAGCSSLLVWLLGLSRVNSLKCRMDPRRFWATSTTRPTFRMVYDPNTASTPVFTEIVAVSPMTPLEAVVARLEHQLPHASVNDADRATFESLASGELENEFAIRPINELVSIIRPMRITELAEIIAINRIRSVSPQHVDDFLAQERPSLRSSRRENQIPCPVLFQETVINLLARRTELRYRDAYRILKRAARSTGSQAESLQDELAEHLSSRLRNPHVARSFATTILKASRVVLCRAQCVSEALTIYRAAYFRTYFESAFNATLKQVAA